MSSLPRFLASRMRLTDFDVMPHSVGASLVYVSRGAELEAILREGGYSFHRIDAHLYAVRDRPSAEGYRSEGPRGFGN